MKTYRCLCAAFVAALLLTIAAPVRSVNYTANWWDPAKDGMGQPCVQQDRTIFCIWFLYDSAKRGTFLISSGILQKDAQGRDYYAEKLYRATGTPPVNYDPSQKQTTEVGTMKLTFSDAYNATFEYTFDGQTGSIQLAPYQFGCAPPKKWDVQSLACVASGPTVTPMGVKVAGANQLPSGCTSWVQQCWKDSIANGTVKLVATSALMTGYSTRPVVFAYFKNASGYWNYLPFYADDLTPFGPDISGGSTGDTDWIVGTSRGIVFHVTASGLCYDYAWDVVQKSWDINGTGAGTPSACPAA